MQIELQGRTALITGSTRGIGAAIARQLAACGARVILHGRSQDSVAQAVGRLRTQNPGVEVLGAAGDLASEGGCCGILRLIDDVDVLVHNAGIYEWLPFTDITDDAWLRMFNVHVMAGVRLARAALPRMLKKNWGRIVFISSDSGMYIPGEMMHYGVTKAAELALMRGLSELSKSSAVTVNAVLPGPTAVEGAEGFFDDYAARNDVPRESAERHFIRASRPTSLIDRMASVDEVANLVTYVCSPLSSATNGAALRAEGGILRHL
ncbi:short-subunit dehydrogenase [Paraburkholderia sp. BL18I3N2]|uniref:SDR family NAD(P)-dependent oxidoreductase n=1 Tax=Paraburkholderia sp. BL18I3N2 TaxID=1938799 RepID=UPI000D074EE4|nr:SDR family oxidoreductase [Paraburkholderia sp. BL18I3N2]PRX27367.1 short-subunit dehydrogenase [Paraburkholderia sp. BL18I3N2]